MKLGCACDATIVDQTDFLPYKAFYIADQDLEDIPNAIEDALTQLVAAITDSHQLERWRAALHAPATYSARELFMQEVWGSISQYTRTMYQCPECGRVYLEQDHPTIMVGFTPDMADAPRSLLRSVAGDAWRMPLVGIWNERSGGRLSTHVEGQDETFDSWDLLAARYYTVFAQLQQQDRLRTALLKKDGVVIHWWQHHPREDGLPSAQLPTPPDRLV